MAKTNQELTSFQKEWELICKKGFADYSSLTREERVWFNVQALIGQVDNGGVVSHFYNMGANRNQETIEDLQFLGFQDIAEILIKVSALFPNGIVPTDITERNKVISSWPDGKYDNLFAQLDKQFYKKEPELEASLVKHIVKLLNGR